MRDIFDESFDELIEKGHIEQAGVGTVGEPIYSLTDKPIEQERYKTALRKALADNSPAEILKRMAKSD